MPGREGGGGKRYGGEITKHGTKRPQKQQGLLWTGRKGMRGYGGGDRYTVTTRMSKWSKLFREVTSTCTKNDLQRQGMGYG